MNKTVKWLHPVVKTGNRGKLLILMALIGLALNLRSPLTSLSPIIGELQTELGMSSTLAGLLTTIPILCFGLLTPFASGFIARMGIEASIATTLCGVVLGTVIRSIDGVASALVGTIILGAALTVGNIVSLMVIARDFAHRSNSVTGAYTSALNIGTMFTTAFTAPLAIAFGWRMATSFWVVLALVAGVLWGMVFLRSRRRKESSSPALVDRHESSIGRSVEDLSPVVGRLRLPVWKRRIVWLLVVAFAAHLFLYYAITAWLPYYLMETSSMDATSAGIAASAFQICALVGAFGIPALAASGRFSNTVLLSGIGGCWLAIPIGLFIAPSLWPLWALIGGIAQGGGFTIIFMLMVDQSYDIDDNRRISSLVQGLGYTIASLGPIVIGSLHQYFGQWLPSFIFLAVIAMLLLLVSMVMPKGSNLKQEQMARRERFSRFHQ